MLIRTSSLPKAAAAPSTSARALVGLGQIDGRDMRAPAGGGYGGRCRVRFGPRRL